MCPGTSFASLFANDLFQYMVVFFLKELFFNRFKHSFFLEVWVDENFHHYVVRRFLKREREGTGREGKGTLQTVQVYEA